MSKAPMRVCVTGAAGQIGYALIAMIAQGDMLGKDQPVILHLLDLPFAMESLGGSAMELADGDFPLVAGVVPTDKPEVAFKDCDVALLVGAFPRKQGMERKELMEKNIGIFKQMGQAINDHAKPTIKVLVVGNPANTNCVVCSHYASKVPKENFTAMTRLDHNRATFQIADKAGTTIDKVKGVFIWGNHSSTQYPDVNHGTVNGKPVKQVITDKAWLEGEFIKTVQQRGAAIINARKASSALSAARAAVLHVRDWVLGTDEVVSMAVITDGSHYGIQAGLCYSFPVKCSNGKWEVVKGLSVDEFSQKKMKETEAELSEEKKLAMSLV